MSKTKISSTLSKILEGGSLKKQLQLLIDDIALDNYGQPRLLTDQEAVSLKKAIVSTDYGRDKYNSMIDALRGLQQAIGFSETLILNYELECQKISSAAYIWYLYTNEEELINEILIELEDMPKAREKVLKRVLSYNHIFVEFGIDEEDLLELIIDKGGTKSEPSYSLRAMLDNLKEGATNRLSEAKAILAAAMDYLNFAYVKPTFYAERFNGLEERLFRDQAVIPRYSKSKLGVSGELEDSAKDLLDQYAIYPDVKETEINEEIYSVVLQNIFKTSAAKVREALGNE